MRIMDEVEQKIHSEKPAAVKNDPPSPENGKKGENDINDDDNNRMLNSAKPEIEAVSQEFTMISGCASDSGTERGGSSHNELLFDDSAHPSNNRATDEDVDNNIVVASAASSGPRKRNEEEKIPFFSDLADIRTKLSQGKAWIRRKKPDAETWCHEKISAYRTQLIRERDNHFRHRETTNNNTISNNCASNECQVTDDASGILPSECEFHGTQSSLANIHGEVEPPMSKSKYQATRSNQFFAGCSCPRRCKPLNFDPQPTVSNIDAQIETLEEILSVPYDEDDGRDAFLQKHSKHNPDSVLTQRHGHHS